jgi:hypothetical protein
MSTEHERDGLAERLRPVGLQCHMVEECMVLPPKGNIPQNDSRKSTESDALPMIRA